MRAVLPFLPAGDARLSRSGIDAYLAHRYIPAPLTVIEGIARLEGADGTPYFVLTKSGLYTPPCFLTDDEPGTLTVVRKVPRHLAALALAVALVAIPAVIPDEAGAMRMSERRARSACVTG